MPVSAHQQARPRSTGEILDDAWLLYQGAAPLLLSAYGLFMVPAAAAFILVVMQPVPIASGARFLWPAVAAALLPLTGLGTGACQEAFHLWTEDRPVSLSRCLHAALRRSLNHVAAQALVLLLPMLALLFLVTPDMPLAARCVLAGCCLALAAPIWTMGLTRHTVLTAGQRNLWRAWRLARRAAGRSPGRAMVLAGVQLLLLAFALLNLHLFVQLALWAGDELAGFNLAFVARLLSPGSPAYVLILVALAWWLLAPYNEAVNYLFLVDARTRYEGLDLRYRIEQLFPLQRSVKAGAVLFLIGAGSLLTAGFAHASSRLAVVRESRQELAAITKRAETADPRLPQLARM